MKALPRPESRKIKSALTSKKEQSCKFTHLQVNQFTDGNSIFKIQIYQTIKYPQGKPQIKEEKP